MSTDPRRPATLSALFSDAALWTARQSGRGSTFALACSLVLGWAAAGPLFGFSDTWQLVINTGTTIVTFLMVFLLQHAQNRDSAITQAKLDELLRLLREERADSRIPDLQREERRSRSRR